MGDSWFYYRYYSNIYGCINWFVYVWTNIVFKGQIYKCFIILEYEESEDEESGKDWDELEEEAMKGNHH